MAQYGPASIAPKINIKSNASRNELKNIKGKASKAINVATPLNLKFGNTVKTDMVEAYTNIVIVVTVPAIIQINAKTFKFNSIIHNVGSTSPVNIVAIPPTTPSSMPANARPTKVPQKPPFSLLAIRFQAPIYCNHTTAYANIASKPNIQFVSFVASKLFKDARLSALSNLINIYMVKASMMGTVIFESLKPILGSIINKIKGNVIPPIIA